MKRLTALLLCLIMVFSLCACGENPGKDTENPNFTDPPEMTAPDGRPVYSDTPTIEYPQTGEYKETALLTNVPGQGYPLLLDMRPDGTIDYIFGSTDRDIHMQSFGGNEAKFYTIAPDGTATLHKEDWVTQIDNYLDITNKAAALSNGSWEFKFSAENGVVLILGQFGPNKYAHSGYLHSVLFKVENDQVVIVPIGYQLEVNGQTVDLKTNEIIDMRLENGHILLEAIYSIRNDHITDRYCWAVFRMDGTLVDLEWMDEDVYWSDLREDGIHLPHAAVDSEGQIHIAPTELDYAPYTDDDTLYNLGKFRNPRYWNVKHTPAVAYDGNGNFCCFFDEAGLGLLIRYDHNPEGAIEPEVLTVWSMEHNTVIAAAVAQWNHTHGSPIFRYTTMADELEGTSLTEEDIITRLNLQLLNGQGPDVLVMDGLYVEKYMEFMVPLDRLNTDGVFQSVLDRFTVNNELLALPMRTVPYLIGRLAEGTQQIHSLEEFADMITTAGPVLDVRDTEQQIPHPSAQYRLRNHDQLFRLWYPAWAEAIWAGGKLNKDVFAEFLTQTTRLVDHYTLTGPGDDYGEVKDTAFIPAMGDWTDQHYDNRQVPYTLVSPNYVGIHTYWDYDYTPRGTAKVIPHYIEGIPGPDGTGAMVPILITGVRAGGNEEAGLEFVQSLLSRQLQLGMDYYTGSYGGNYGYPVVWEYVQDAIHREEIDRKQECAVENSYEDTITNLRTVIIDEYLFEEALIAARSCYRTEDRLSPEQAAEALSEATRIYLAELR